MVDFLPDSIFGVLYGFNNTRNYGVDCVHVNQGEVLLLYLGVHGMLVVELHSRIGYLPHSLEYGHLRMLALLNHAVIKLESSVGVVSSVSNLGLLYYSFLLGLKVADGKAITFKHLLDFEGVLLLNLVGKFGRLELDDGVLGLGFVVHVVNEMHIFDSVRPGDTLKILSELRLFSFWWEALHKEFAFLIGILFLVYILGALLLRQRLRDVELLSIEFLLVHFFDSQSGVFRVLETHIGVQSDGRILFG